MIFFPPQNSFFVDNGANLHRDNLIDLTITFRTTGIILSSFFRWMELTVQLLFTMF